MRLIDADALVWTFVRIVSPSGDQADVSVPDIAAAPTIPTTTKRNGVTSCSFCGCVVDIEYPEES